MKAAHWVATLSNGTTVTEEEGDFKIIPGERKPWVRLVEKLATDGHYLTSLRLQIGKRTIHLPRPQNNKFESLPPLYYSLCYRMELDDILGNKKQKLFVDLAAHYETFAVHYIQDITEGNNSWICVTDNQALAPSPIWKLK